MKKTYTEPGTAITKGKRYFALVLALALVIGLMPVMESRADAPLSLDKEDIYLYPGEVVPLTVNTVGEVQWEKGPSNAPVTLYTDENCTAPLDSGNTTTTTVYVKANEGITSPQNATITVEQGSFSKDCTVHLFNPDFVEITLDLGEGHEELAAGVKDWLCSYGATGDENSHDPQFKCKNGNVTGHTITISIATVKPDSNSTSVTVGDVHTLVGEAVKATVGETRINNGAVFIGVGRRAIDQYDTLDALADELLMNTEGFTETIAADATFHILWATPIPSVSVTVEQPQVGSIIGGNSQPAFTLPAGAKYSMKQTSESPSWLNSTGSTLGVQETVAAGMTYSASVTLSPEIGYCFTDSTVITAKTANDTILNDVRTTISTIPHGFTGCQMLIRTNGITPASGSHTVSFDANGGTLRESSPMQGTTFSAPQAPVRSGYLFEGWWTAPSGGTKITFPYTPTDDVTLYAHWKRTIPFVSSAQMSYILASVTEPSLTGIYTSGADVMSKLPTDTTILLTNGSERGVSIEWTKISGAEKEERYRGTIVLPSDVTNPNAIPTSFEYVAKLIGIELVSIDAPIDHGVFAFGEESTIPKKCPQVAVLHLADDSTREANIKWRQVSKSEDEIKYRGTIQLPDDVINLNKISTTVMFTAKLIEKPTGHFELEKLTLDYTDNPQYVMLLDYSEGEITYASDDEQIVRVSPSRSYDLNTGQTVDIGKYAVLDFVAAGTTTIHAFINGYEVDTLVVTVNKATQKLKVTYNKKTSYTIAETVLKEKPIRLTLNISGNKTPCKYSCKKPLSFNLSAKRLTIVKGAKKGTYVFTVRAAASKKYKAAKVTFTVNVK